MNKVVLLKNGKFALAIRVMILDYWNYIFIVDTPVHLLFVHILIMFDFSDNVFSLEQQ